MFLTHAVKVNKIYRLGFPDETFNREKDGVPNSDGISFYVTRREELGAKKSFEKCFFNTDIIDGSLFYSIRDDIYVYDADNVKGMSGGSIVDAEGKVVGVTTAIFTTREEKGSGGHTKHSEFESVSLHIRWIKELMDTYQFHQ